MVIGTSRSDWNEGELGSEIGGGGRRDRIVAGGGEGPSVGEEGPEPGGVEVEAELEAEDGCLMFSAGNKQMVVGAGRLTREEDIDGVEHVVKDTARLRLQLGLGRVGDEVGEYEERDECLKLPRLIKGLSFLSHASGQTRISSPKRDFCRFHCGSNRIHPR